MQANPLLRDQEIPQFDQITAQHVESAVQTRVAELSKDLLALESSIKPTWATSIEPLSVIEESLHRCWSPVEHLNSVANSPELREAYDKAQQLIVDFHLRYLQSQPVFDALVQMQKGSEWAKLDEAQKRSIEQRIRGAQLSGLALKGAEREEFNALNKELSQLEATFSNNVLDATKEFVLVISDKKDVVGFPESLLELSVQMYNARFPDKTKASRDAGPWAITLDAPVFVPFLENCQNRDLRKQVYFAYLTRASSGKQDNTPNITRILQIRKRIAKLLNYKNYAELSLARKMVQSVDEVLQFEEELRSVAIKKAKDEFVELENFAKSQGSKEALRHWDIAYWANKFQEHSFQFNDEDLRPYFSLDHVLSGLFSVVHKLFAVTVRKATGAPVWNSDVRYFELLNEQSKVVAAFYLDPFSRPQNKRGGAWMSDCVTHFRYKGKTQLPVAQMVCNFTPPTETKPSLLTFEEVQTLFHEFGHALQHMLTTVPYRDVSGTHGVEWDAVETPSQFMENWCYHRNTLMKLGKHFQTGEPLPKELVDKVLASHTFRAASQMVRQIQLGLIDLRLHADYDPDSKRSIFDLHKEVASATSVLPFLDEDRMLCGFSHIFSGSYAAGYYSYKWAEVMSADAFAAFEEAGLDKEDTLKNIGKKFKETFLACGGGRAPLQVFIDFRGRKPSTQALLRHAGLV